MVRVVFILRAQLATVCWTGDLEAGILPKGIERFTVESCVRSYHVYKGILEASVGEELPCQRENGNCADSYAVAIVKVGHIQRKISLVCSLFLRRNGVIKICTIGRRRFSADLPQGGA